MIESRISNYVSPKPICPKSIKDTGLTRTFISDLIIKHLYRYGQLSGNDIAQYLKLPFYIFDTVLDDLLTQGIAEKKGGRGLGHTHDSFVLLQNGIGYAQAVLAKDTYTGPAPVPLEQYTDLIVSHARLYSAVQLDILQKSWEDFVLDKEYFAQIGPAICSCSSCFLYGPPGTGKTVLAKAIAQCIYEFSGDMAIPYSILVGGYIIQVFDPIYHERTEPEESPLVVKFRSDQSDNRWVLCKRPTVIVGGEMTAQMLDLQLNPSTHYYEAPLQLKANGGVLIIDDFGRQQIKPKVLLNRWILPLEEKIDYLSLHTGKKFPVPFEQFVIFATNLNPQQLVDEAFLRRIRYKIYIGQISTESYMKIFAQECKKKKLMIHEDHLEKIIQIFYIQRNLPLRACDPRDITNKICDYCTFNQLPKTIHYDLLEKIFENYLEYSTLRMSSSLSA